MLRTQTDDGERVLVCGAKGQSEPDTESLGVNSNLSYLTPA